MTAQTATSHCHRRPCSSASDFGDASARAVIIVSVVAAGCDARPPSIDAERLAPPRYLTVEQIARLDTERWRHRRQPVAHLMMVTNNAEGEAS